MKFRYLKTGDLDVFITSGTFFSGIFLALIQKLDENGSCGNDTVCIAYGISLSVTTLSWIFLAAFAILYRLHHEKINRIIVVTTHLLMRLSVVLSIIAINLSLWYQYDMTIGPIAGLCTAIFATVMTVIVMIIYLIDLYQYKKKHGLDNIQE